MSVPGDGSTGSVLWRAGIRARRFILRTQWGPLRPVWTLAYEILLRGIALSLRTGRRAAVYVGGTFGTGEPIYGISDIDLIVVSPGGGVGLGPSRAAIKRRWARVCRAFPPLAWIVEGIFVYDQEELADVTAATRLTYGLHGTGRRTPAAAFEGAAAPVDEGWLLGRPGVWPTREWRRLAGPDLRPPNRPDEHVSRHAAWLELQFWWRFAYRASLDPGNPHVPYMCVKLVAEPARIWLWLAYGEQLFRRRAVLERALELIPEEEESLRRALELHDRLHRSPEPSLAEVLPCLLRLSSRIVQQLEAAARAGDTTEVALVGDRNGPILGEGADELGRISARWPGVTALPLADWHARTLPATPESSFAIVPGSPDDPELLAAAAEVAGPAVLPALRADGLLALPVPPGHVSGPRSLQCPLSDPVSFALADGASHAIFAEAPGWSARDCALRAAAEHLGWLEPRATEALVGGDPLPDRHSRETLGRLLSAARAADFLESVEAGRARLALDLTSAAELLGEAAGPTRTVADEARSAWEASRAGGPAPGHSTLVALLGVVRSLPCYARTRA